MHVKLLTSKSVFRALHEQCDGKRDGSLVRVPVDFLRHLLIDHSVMCGALAGHTTEPPDPEEVLLS